MVGAHLTFRVSDVGLAPPPVDVRLSLTRGRRDSTLLVKRLHEGPVAKLVEWVESFHPETLSLGSDGVVFARMEDMTPPWEAITRAGAAITATVTMAGEISLMSAGARTASAISRALVPGEIELGPVSQPARIGRFLTSGQEDALTAAVQSGYYRIPRPVNLHELAHRMHVSSASLSERLRRAEGRVITRFVELGKVSRWDVPGAPSGHS